MNLFVDSKLNPKWEEYKNNNIINLNEWVILTENNFPCKGQRFNKIVINNVISKNIVKEIIVPMSINNNIFYF